MKKDFSYGVIPLRQEKNRWQVLFVQHRAGHWGFPKGHAEINESSKETAERELFEETGLKIKQYLYDQVIEEMYFFKQENELIKKRVGYFIAVVEGQVNIQLEEINEFEWVWLDESLPLLSFSQSKKIIQRTQQVLSRL